MIKLKTLNKNYIPKLVDPECSSWRQPDRENILVDDTYALMTLSTFNALQDFPEKWHYKRREGKMCRDKGTFYWYGLHEKPNMVSLHFRKILVSES